MTFGTTCMQPPAYIVAEGRGRRGELGLTVAWSAIYGVLSRGFRRPTCTVTFV